MQKHQSIFNPSIYISFPGHKNEKDLRFTKNNFITTSSTQELLSRLLFTVLESEALWEREAELATTLERQPATYFSRLHQSWWSLTEAGCQSPWKDLLQPRKLPRSWKQFISSTTLRDLFRSRFVKSTFKALLKHITSQKRWSGSLQELNGSVLFIYLLILGWSSQGEPTVHLKGVPTHCAWKKVHSQMSKQESFYRPSKTVTVSSAEGPWQPPVVEDHHSSVTLHYRQKFLWAIILFSSLHTVLYPQFFLYHTIKHPHQIYQKQSFPVSNTWSSFFTVCNQSFHVKEFSLLPVGKDKNNSVWRYKNIKVISVPPAQIQCLMNPTVSSSLVQWLPKL